MIFLYTGTSTKAVLGVGAEVFALFLAWSPGRLQVFNEYFHSSSAVWRDSSVAGGVERGWWTEEVGRDERRVGSGRGCGEGRREGLGWRGPALGCPPGAHGAGPGR